MLGVSIKCVREHNDITTLIAKRQGIGLREHTATEVVAVCVGVHRVVNEDAVRNRTGGKRIQSPEADLKGSIAGFVGKAPSSQARTVWPAGEARNVSQVTERIYVDGCVK